MKKSFPWLVLVVGIFFSTLLWSSITIPYDQSNTIVGQYSISKINPLNDTLRGLFFIFFPLTLYLIVFLNINRNLVTNQIFKNDYLSSSKNLNYLSVLLISFSVLEFYSLNYKNFLGIIDVHHEGTFLTAQLNFLLKDKVWTGTFFDYGFLGNTIGICPNYIFDNYTIGIQRFFFKFLILLNKIFLILICKEITNCIDLKKKKEIFFLIFSLSALTLASFYEDVTPFHSRTFIYLIFALLTFKLIKSKNNIILSLALSSFSLLSLLFYWDIGSYINVLLVFLLIYLLFTRRYKEFYTLFSGIIICWLIFYILTPLDEFKQFFNQYLIIINISDYLIGIEFPKPFSDKSTRHTKALLLIIFSAY